MMELWILGCASVHVKLCPIKLNISIIISLSNYIRECLDIYWFYAYDISNDKNRLNRIIGGQYDAHHFLFYSVILGVFFYYSVIIWNATHDKMLIHSKIQMPIDYQIKYQQMALISDPPAAVCSTKSINKLGGPLSLHLLADFLASWPDCSL